MTDDRPDDCADPDRPSRTPAAELLQGLLEEARQQTRLLAALRSSADLDACLLDKIGRIACMSANEAHRNGALLASVQESLAALLTMYRSVHPEQALQLDRMARLEAQSQKCCPTEAPPDSICHYEPCQPEGGIRRGDGYSVKSRGRIEALQISEHPHEPWDIRARPLNDDDEALPQVLQGLLVGAMRPAAARRRRAGRSR